MNKALKYLIYSQASFLAFIAVCFMLQPDAFKSSAALSYYGTTSVTIVPYAAGTFLAAFFLLKAAGQLANQKLSVVRNSLKAMAALLVAMLFVPYTVNKTFSDIHLALSGLLLLAVLVVSFYIVVAVDRKPLNIIIILLELATIVLLYLSLVGEIYLHGPSELLMSLLFIGLMYNTLKDIKEDSVLPRV